MNKAYMRHIPFIIVLAIVSLVMTRGGERDNRPRAGEWIELAEAQPAPEGSMEVDEKGTRLDFASTKGNVVLLNIWATWCTPCLKELPTLKALDEMYKGKDLRVITLSIDELPFEEVEMFLARKVKLDLTTLALDDKGELAEQVDIRGLPVTYLITRDGRITHRFIGATDWLSDEARAPIDAELLKK